MPRTPDAAFIERCTKLHDTIENATKEQVAQLVLDAKRFGKESVEMAYALATKGRLARWSQEDLAGGADGLHRALGIAKKEGLAPDISSGWLRTLAFVRHDLGQADQAIAAAEKARALTGPPVGDRMHPETIAAIEGLVHTMRIAVHPVLPELRELAKMWPSMGEGSRKVQLEVLQRFVQRRKDLKPPEIECLRKITAEERGVQAVLPPPEVKADPAELAKVLAEQPSVPERWAPISTLEEDVNASRVASVRGSSSRLDAVTQGLLADLRGSSTTAIRAALKRITEARKQGEKIPAHLHMAIHYIFTDERTYPETRRLAALYYVGAALDGLASPEVAARRRAARYIWGWACERRHGQPSTDKFPFVAAAVPAALDDPDEEVRHSATLALLIRNWKGALDYTTDLAEWALRSASPARRKSAAQALRTALGEPDAASAATALVPLVIEGMLAPDDPSARVMEQPCDHAASAAGALIRAGGDVRAVIPHVVKWLSRPSADYSARRACEVLEVAAEHGIDIRAVIPHVVEWLSRTSDGYSAQRACEVLEVAAKHGIDISAAVPALEAASARPDAGVRPAASRALSHHFRNTGREAKLTRHDFTKSLGMCTSLELSHRPVHAETDQEVKGAEPQRCGHCGSEQTACVFRASTWLPTAEVETSEYRCTACGKFTVYKIVTYDD